MKYDQFIEYMISKWRSDHSSHFNAMSFQNYNLMTFIYCLVFVEIMKWNEMKSPCCNSYYDLPNNLSNVTYYNFERNKPHNSNYTFSWFSCDKKFTSGILHTSDNPLYYHPNFISNTHHLVVRCDYQLVREWVSTTNDVLELTKLN